MFSLNHQRKEARRINKKNKSPDELKKQNKNEDTIEHDLHKSNQKQKTVIEVKILKREKKLKRRYLVGQFKETFNAKMNQRTSLFCRYNVKMKIKKGDVLKVIFPISFGSEIAGEHFVVAISPSTEKSSLLTVIPLKSLKEKGINPASDLILGKIPGLNQKTAVAIINQPQTIDKYRICVDDLINIVDSKYYKNKFDNGEEVLFYKTSYRLTKEQLRLLIKSFTYFIERDYLRH
ncbi:MAG: type II toxin-antitoxin system PemK/MazF family toxin [Erysipelotrichia bacterium]|nr:type II toxin-antitoxin system PemK/MazF family toxin [Erysipelotrichia bacterium]